MSQLEIFIVALSLSLDAFAVSLAAGTAGHAGNARAIFRLSFHFGLFQFLMPVAGWAIGRQFAPLIASFDHWIAFGLLAFVGVHMIRSAGNASLSARLGDSSRGWTLVTLAFATSIDSLAVGFGLAALGEMVWYPCVVIGVVTLAMSVLAIVGGRTIGKRLGTRAQIGGGVVLLALAVKILVEHLS